MSLNMTVDFLNCMKCCEEGERRGPCMGNDAMLIPSVIRLGPRLGHGLTGSG